MISISQIGHTADKKLIEFSQRSLEQFKTRKDIGFGQIPQRADLWHEIDILAKRLRKNYQDLVLVGVGGSSLGVRVLKETFYLKNLHFVDNVDDFDFENILSGLPLEKTLFVFVSKSGTTIETLAAFEFIQIILRERSLELNRQAIVITEDKPSSLKSWAESHHVPCLDIPFDVGGRFSVLTAVGMFPAAFFGLDIEAFRRGAQAAVEDDVPVVTMMAQALQSWQNEHWIFVYWAYSNRMRYFGAWFQQLWAESLAKKITRSGAVAPRVSTPLALIGASDQHSVLQQIMEGAKDKFLVFHRFEDAERGERRLTVATFPETKDLNGKSLGHLLAAEAAATQESLAEQGLSTMTLATKVLNEEGLGYLFMFWQRVVAGLGEALDVDAFNQPGVEAGKVLAKQKLAQS